MNLGELEDGISAEEQLLEVLGDKNKEEENAEEVQAKEQPPGRIRNKRGKQLFTVPEAIQMRGRPHGPHQVLPPDLRSVLHCADKRR